MQFAALRILSQARRGAEDLGEKLLICNDLKGLSERTHSLNEIFEIFLIYEQLFIFRVVSRNDDDSVLFSLLESLALFLPQIRAVHAHGVRPNQSSYGHMASMYITSVHIVHTYSIGSDQQCQ